MTRTPRDGTDHFEYDLYRAAVSGTALERIFHKARLLELRSLASLDDGPVLDFGCNSGAFLIPLRAQGLAIEGFDISETNVARARAYLAERGLVADLHVGRLPDRRWSTILLLNVLEYATDKSALVAQLVAHLAPGGRVAVAVANSAHPFIRNRWLRAVLSGRDRGDVERAEPERNLDDASVRRLFAEAGLRLVRTRYGLAWINRYYLFQARDAAET